MHLSFLIDCKCKKIVTASRSQDIDDVLVARLEGASWSILLQAAIARTVNCVPQGLPPAYVPTSMFHSTALSLWEEFGDINVGNLKGRCVRAKQIRKGKDYATLQTATGVHLNHRVICET